YSSNSSAGFGWVSDALYDSTGLAAGGSSLELTTAWGITGFFQHVWNSRWRTSIYGGYNEIDYNRTATNPIHPQLPTPPVGATACGVPVQGAVAPPINVGTGLGNSCSPNFSWWTVGTRTQWNPHPDLDIGVDVQWNHLNTAYKGAPAPGIVASLGQNGA